MSCKPGLQEAFVKINVRIHRGVKILQVGHESRHYDINMLTPRSQYVIVIRPDGGQYYKESRVYCNGLATASVGTQSVYIF